MPTFRIIAKTDVVQSLAPVNTYVNGLGDIFNEDPVTNARISQTSNGSPTLAQALCGGQTLFPMGGTQAQFQDPADGGVILDTWYAVALPFATDPDGTVARGNEVPAPDMSATTWVMAPFTQPAINASVTVTIDDTTWPAAWLGNTPEAPIFIAGGGWYTITAVDTEAKTITVTNLGKAGAIVSVSC